MENFKRTFQPPFLFNIPNDIDNHLKQIPFYKRYFKFMRRYLYIYLKGQKNHEIYTILPKHKKILWINMSAPSLGDSLMDLSSRIMLEDKQIDLFTDTKNSNLYESDSIFKNIYVDKRKKHSLEKLYKDMLNFVPSKRIKLNTILKRINI